MYGGGGGQRAQIKLYLPVHQRCTCKNMSACVSEKAITSHKDKITSSMASSPALRVIVMHIAIMHTAGSTQSTLALRQ